jgi:hypothetical protein
MASTAYLPMTPLAALLHAELRSARGVGLPTYLAIARTPGAGWKTYDEIVTDLTALTGRPLNRVSIKTYTEDTFGIPNTRYALVNGKPVKMPHAVPQDALYAYIVSLNAGVIAVDAVLAAAAQLVEADEIRAEAEAMVDAAAESNLPA